MTPEVPHMSRHRFSSNVNADILLFQQLFLPPRHPPPLLFTAPCQSPTSAGLTRLIHRWRGGRFLSFHAHCRVPSFSTHPAPFTLLPKRLLPQFFSAAGLLQIAIHLPKTPPPDSLPQLLCRLLPFNWYNTLLFTHQACHLALFK